MGTTYKRRAPTFTAAFAPTALQPRATLAAPVSNSTQASDLEATRESEPAASAVETPTLDQAGDQGPATESGGTTDVITVNRQAMREMDTWDAAAAVAQEESRSAGTDSRSASLEEQLQAKYDDLHDKEEALGVARDAAAAAQAKYEAMAATEPEQSHYMKQATGPDGRPMVGSDGNPVMVADVDAYEAAKGSFLAEHACSVEEAHARWMALEKSVADLERAIEDLLEEIRALEAQAGSDDEQLESIDMQNALQRQQQTVQTMSNVSKMLHDSDMASIRKIG